MAKKLLKKQRRQEIYEKKSKVRVGDEVYVNNAGLFSGIYSKVIKINKGKYILAGRPGETYTRKQFVKL